MMDLQNYYYWFYSTITQSLASLIGIVGVFAIFRIQLLVNVIDSRIRDLQQLIDAELWSALGDSSKPEPGKENISINIKKIVEALSKTLDNYENMIQQNIRNSQNQQGSVDCNNELRTKKQSIKDRINVLKNQEFFINGQKTLKCKITHSAKILIVVLIILLIESIICLSLVEIICHSPYWSKTLILATVVLLLGALYLLSRLCWISLKAETD